MSKLSKEERVAIAQTYRELCAEENLQALLPLRSEVQAFWQRWSREESMRNAFGLPRPHLALQALLLAHREIGLGGRALVAIVLRSAVSSEEALQDAERRFGTDVANALRAFERADKLLEAKTESMQTDDFRNLFVAQCGDMRVVLLLIAHCVCLMRSIKDLPQDAERRRLSVEAAYLYAPLAHKLGLYTLKSELEDLSLKYLEHDAYYLIKDKLNATKRSRDAYIERFIAPLRTQLAAEGIDCHIKGRTKSIHSIWKKMQKQHCGFEGVYDLFAIRIIIKAEPKQERELCWKAFSIITNEYESNLRRLRDWITVPKSNGYESLHITVLGPEDKWVEVQIRTERMDEIAEHGLAAHWRYKGIRATDTGVDDLLANIRGALETGDEAQLSKNLAAAPDEKNIYVFSPKGDLYKLPRGATVLDFAYLIHTGLGNKCVGGRIDGKNVPIRQELQSGQKVEILTSTSQTPKLEWLQIVVSSKAKSKIRAAVAALHAADADFVREDLERKLKNRKTPWDESIWNRLIKRLGYKETTEFYRALSSKALDAGDVVEQYIAAYTAATAPRQHTAERSAGEFDFAEMQQESELAMSGEELVIGPNLKGIDFRLAACCHPVYGDAIFGFVTSSGTIKIHRTSCPNAAALRTRFPYRIVNARWAGKGGAKYPITLHVIGRDDLGIVNNITSIISKEENIMLRSISIDTNDGLFSGILTVLVDDTQVLSRLIKKLQTVKGVKAVSR